MISFYKIDGGFFYVLYGNILTAFHGKAEDVRKMAQRMWKRPDLEELAEGLNGIPAVDGDAVVTVTVEIGVDCLNAELPCIDFLADHGAGVEVAVVAWLSDSITDTQGRFSACYPLDRELYQWDEIEDEGDEDDEGEEDEEYEEEDFDFDVLEYLEYREKDDSWFDDYPDWLRAWEDNGFR